MSIHLTDRRSNTGNPYVVSIGADDGILIVPDGTNQYCIELTGDDDIVCFATSSLATEAHAIETSMLTQGKKILQEIKDAKQALDDTAEFVSDSLKMHLTGQDPSINCRIMVLFDKLVDYKQGQIDVDYDKNPEQTNKEISALKTVNSEALVVFLKDVCRSELWFDEMVVDYNRIKECYQMLERYMTDHKTAQKTHSTNDYQVTQKKYTSQLVRFSALDKQIFKNLLEHANQLWVHNTSVQPPVLQISTPPVVLWQPADDLIASLQKHAGGVSQNFGDCVVQKFFEKNEDGKRIPYEPCNKTRKKAMSHALTGDEHIPQLKLEVSLRIAIMEYLQTSFESRRMRDERYSMDMQLKNTVVVYVGSHHSHENMQRSQIHMLLDQFPFIQFVLVDYDQRSLWVKEAVHEDHYSRVHVITTKFNEAIAERVGKWLDDKGLDVLLLSDIRSDLNLEAIQNHTRLFAGCLVQAQGCLDPDHRNLLLHDAADLARNLIELQLERESTVARDDNTQASWLSKMKCMARLKVTMPYPIPAAPVFFSNDPSIHEIKDRIALPFGNCVFMAQPFSGNSTEMSTIIKPQTMRTQSDWGHHGGKRSLLKNFLQLFYSSPYYEDKVTFGRHDGLMGGDINIHGYVFPRKPLPLDGSQNDRSYTLEEFDAIFAMFNNSGDRNKLLHLADAMYREFKTKVSVNERRHCKTVYDTAAYKLMAIKHAKTRVQDYADTITMHALQKVDVSSQSVIATLSEYVQTLQVNPEVKIDFEQRMFRGGSRMQLIQGPVNRFMQHVFKKTDSSQQLEQAMDLGDFVIDTMDNIALCVSDAAKYYLALIIDVNRSKVAKGGMDIKHPFGIPHDMTYFKVVILAHFRRLQSIVGLQNKETDLKNLSSMIYITLKKYTKLDRGFLPREVPTPRQEDDSHLTEEERKIKLEKEEAHMERRKIWFQKTKEYHDRLPMWLCCKVLYMLTHLLDMTSKGMRELCLDKVVNLYMQNVQQQCQNELDRLHQNAQSNLVLNVMPYTWSVFFIANASTQSGIMLTNSYHIEMFPFLLTFGPKTSVDVWKQYDTIFTDGWKIRKYDKSVSGGEVLEEIKREYNVFNWPPRRSIFLCLCERGVYHVVEYILQQVKNEIKYDLKNKFNISDEEVIDCLVQWNLSDFIDQKIGRSVSFLQTCLQSAAFYGQLAVVEVLLKEYDWFSSSQCRKFHIDTGTFTILQDMDLILKSDEFKCTDAKFLRIFAPFPLKYRRISVECVEQIRNTLKGYWEKQRFESLHKEFNVTSDVLKANIEYRLSVMAGKNPKMNSNVVIFNLETDAQKLTASQIKRAASMFTGCMCPIKISTTLWKLVSANDVALYSLTPAVCAEETCAFLNRKIDEIKKRDRSLNTRWSVLDMTAGAGGDTAAFFYTQIFQKVYAVEISDTRFKILQDVLKVYRANFVQAKNVEVNLIHGDSYELMAIPSIQPRKSIPLSTVDVNGNIKPSSIQVQALRKDVQIAYIDPPWGGKNYIIEKQMQDFKMFSHMYDDRDSQQETFPDGPSLQEVVIGLGKNCPNLRIILVKLPRPFVEREAILLSNHLNDQLKGFSGDWQFKEVLYNSSSLLQGFSLLRFGRTSDP